jgi:hypothetical protein
MVLMSLEFMLFGKCVFLLSGMFLSLPNYQPAAVPLWLSATNSDINLELLHKNNERILT